MTVYLDESAAGLRWLLDPASAELGTLARAAEARTIDTPCDADALVADADELATLIAERHFGVATRHVAEPLDTLRQWQQRLEAKPGTWGEALTELQAELRKALVDEHIRLPGAAKRYEVRAPEPGVREELHGDVLVLRIARLIGDPDDERLLAEWVAGADRHFEHARIVVDLRGNTGGNDGHTWDWASPRFRPVPLFVTDSTWCVRGTPVGYWNAAAWREARDGRDALPRVLRDGKHEPRAEDELEVVREQASLDAGERPWTGRMIVVVDRRTASSGESSAWLIRSGLGATLVGEPTAGMIEYGNIVPYVLPRSGLVIQLPTKRNDFGFPVEGRGFPVDRAVDPAMPIAEVAAHFDSFI